MYPLLGLLIESFLESKLLTRDSHSLMDKESDGVGVQRLGAGKSVMLAVDVHVCPPVLSLCPDLSGLL